MGQRKSEYLQVAARCPSSGAFVATHAWMTARQISRFSGKLVFFCPACREAHLLGGGELRLAEPGAPVEEPTPEPRRALGRRTPAAAKLRPVRHVARVPASPDPTGGAGEQLKLA